MEIYFNSEFIEFKKRHLKSGFNSIVIVGPSCSGKTTIVNSLRNSTLTSSKKFRIPRRITTRPIRENDCKIENQHVNAERFRKLWEAKQIEFFWTRKFGENDPIFYGFEKQELVGIPIYSANNALLLNSTSTTPKNILRKGMFISINAPKKIRVERFKKRSLDILNQKREESKLRLNDNSHNESKLIHITINNDSKHLNNATKAVEQLLIKLHSLTILELQTNGVY